MSKSLSQDDETQAGIHPTSLVESQVYRGLDLSPEILSPFGSGPIFPLMTYALRLTAILMISIHLADVAHSASVDASVHASKDTKKGTQNSKQKEILNEIQKLDIPEQDPDAVKKALARFPRQQVVATVREAINAKGREVVTGLRAAQFLNLNELLPDLRQIAAKTNDWHVVLAATSLSKSQSDRKATSVVYLERLTNGETPAAVKTSMIDGLTEMSMRIPQARVRSLLKDKSFDVQSTAIQHFVELRSDYPNQEQAEWFQLAFRADSPNGRIAAFESYSQLSLADRKKLGVPLAERICSGDTDPRAKSSCLAALKSKEVAK